MSGFLKKLNKPLGMALSLSMLLSPFGTAAFAAESESENEPPSSAPRTVDIDIENHWVGQPKDSYTVSLLANGNEVASVTFDESNNWSYTVEDVPIPTLESIGEVSFSIESDDLEGYYTHVSGDFVNGFDIVHLESPDNEGFVGESIDVNIEKAWIGEPAEQAEIALYVDGLEADRITLSESSDWKHTFSNLPVVENKDGVPVTYTVGVGNIAGYDSIVTGSQEQGFVITSVDSENASVLEGTMVARYVDNEGKEIAYRDILTGKIGSTYKLEPKDIRGYQLLDIQGENEGVYEPGIGEVVFVYEPTVDRDISNDYVEGMVVVKYVNEDGTEIAYRDVVTGKVDDAFNLTLKDINGYKLKRMVLNGEEVPYANGHFIEGISEFVFVYENDEPNQNAVIGTVVVTHVDPHGNELAERDRLSGQIGTSYETQGKVINGYGLWKINGDKTGTFAEGMTFVEYVYAPIVQGDPSDFIGYVIVNFVDEDGNPIADSEEIRGEVGEKYSVEPRQLEGYEFVRIEGNLEGTFGEGGLTVTFVYKAVSNDENIDEEQPANEDENKDEEQPANEDENKDEGNNEETPSNEDENKNDDNQNNNEQPVNEDKNKNNNDGANNDKQPSDNENRDNNDKNNDDNPIMAKLDLIGAYDKLEFGMSYDEVVSLIGANGELNEDAEIYLDDQLIEDAKMYQWQNELGHILSAGFYQDKLVTKSLDAGDIQKSDGATTDDVSYTDDTNANDENGDVTTQNDEAVATDDDIRGKNAEERAIADKKLQGQELPDTATNTYNFMALGAGMVVLAGAGLFMIQRRRKMFDNE